MTVTDFISRHPLGWQFGWFLLIEVRAETRLSRKATVIECCENGG